MGKKKQAMSLAHDDVIVEVDALKKSKDDRQDKTVPDGWILPENYGEQADVEPEHEKE